MRATAHWSASTLQASGRRPRTSRRRNRLLSGLTPGTLVVEAGEGSGALWTVRHAVDQNREVMAVPGSILSPASRESNRLIQDGAKTVLGYADILAELNFSALGQQMELRAVLPQDGRETQLLTWITYEPVHIDEIQRASGLPVAAVSSSLTMMEIRGLVKQVGRHELRQDPGGPSTLRNSKCVRRYVEESGNC